MNLLIIYAVGYVFCYGLIYMWIKTGRLDVKEDDEKKKKRITRIACMVLSFAWPVLIPASIAKTLRKSKKDGEL